MSTNSFTWSKDMGKTNGLYTMMRMSYEMAVDDYNNKKTHSIKDAYQKYYKENVGMDCTNPETDLLMFYDEDNSRDCPL
jgi:hypothetical protein